MLRKNSSFHGFLTRVFFFEGLDLRKVDACVGDPDADKENPVLRAEQEAQVSDFSFNFIYWDINILIKSSWGVSDR